MANILDFRCITSYTYNMNTKEKERWAAIPGYEGWYEVSSLGRVKRVLGSHGTFAGRILCLQRQRNGYVAVPLSKEGVYHTCKIHRLVAAAFLTPKIEGLQVNHINGNKKDNRLDNLEYVTQEENHRHALLTGLKAKGETNGRSKLTKSEVLDIRNRLRSETQMAVVRRYGISRRAIRSIADRTNWAWLKEDGSMETIGKRIQEVRSKSGWTQKELAEKIGYGEQHISNLENDRYKPSMRTIVAIEKALRTKLVG